MRLKWLFLSWLLWGFCALAQQAAPPVLFFSDITYGPASGNSDPTYSATGGAYVTLYGNYLDNFTSIQLNGSSCLTVVSKPAKWLWYERMIVKIGTGCTTGNFSVTTPGGTWTGPVVSGSTPDFTVGPGNIYFVSTNGNDGANGSFAAPFRSTLHGVTAAGANSGNIVYVMNGVLETSTDPAGWNAILTPVAEWCHGTATAPDALVAYPGATVTIGTATSSVQALRSKDFTAADPCSGYWTMAGIIWKSAADTININGPSAGAQHWRWIANDVSNPNSTSGEGAAFETAAVNSAQIFGNYFHDMNLGTTSNLTQGVYLSTDSNHIDFGWNSIYNAKGRTTLQTHSSPLSSGNGYALYDLKVHDNIIHGSSEEGILMDTLDPSKGPVLVYNNVLYDVGRDGSGGNLHYQASGDFDQSHGTGAGSWVEWYNNTVYCMNGEGCYTSAYVDLHNGQQPAQDIHNNLFYSTRASVPYWLIGSDTWSPSFYCDVTNTLAQCPWAKGSTNLLFGNGAPTYTGLLTTSLNADPIFVSGPGFDFHLQSGSPAIGRGVASWSGGTCATATCSAPTYDIDGKIRPSSPSVGAYEYAPGVGGGGPNPPSPPIGLSAVVH